jgi:hypothetical protein
LIEQVATRRNAETRRSEVAPDQAPPPFVVPPAATKQVIPSDQGFRSTFGLNRWMPSSQASSAEQQLAAYEPKVINISKFVEGIRLYAPKNRSGEWLERVSRDLVLTGVNQSVRRVERSGSRAHIFKSDTDHLLVFIPNSGEKLKVTWGKDPEDIHRMAPKWLSEAPYRVQQAAAAALKEMAVALAHRTA